MAFGVRESHAEVSVQIDYPKTGYRYTVCFNAYPKGATVAGHPAVDADLIY